jgi:UDP-N-acetylmuramyl pentapeptide phosphotransferase/UDP-N-acetylglucosamine-1-phosphate transferase
VIGALTAIPWVVLALSFVFAVAVVDLVRRHAVRRRLMDIPNERSSHTTPTARGGGLGVVVVVSVLWLATIGASASLWRLELMLCVAAMLAVATVGWLDDRSSLRVGPRLAVHVLSGVAVAALSVRIGWHWWIGLWWVLWAVSSINVVNFMDGIDGLIASQVTIAMLHFAWLAPSSALARPMALAVAGASAGFLVWNWPPARIFLGDVGSGALGFALVFAGALTMAARSTDVVRVYLPLFPLFLDAAWTLVRRARRGERLTSAHRSHLYQRLANGGWGHRRVSALYAIAAIAGAFVASMPAPTLRWTLTVAYCALVIVSMSILDRRAGDLAGPHRVPSPAR